MNRLIKKYNSISVQAKAALWFTGCNFLQKGVSFITVPIFTRMMSTDEYGVYSLYTSWYQILLIVTSLYLFNGVFDNAMSKFSDDRDRFTASVQGLSITVTLFVFIIFIVTNRLWEQALGLPRKFIILMFAEMLVAPSLYYWSARQRFEYQYQRLVFVTVSKTIINPCLGLLLVYLFPDKALGRVFSIVLTELVFDVSVMIYQFAKGRVFFDRQYWRYAITLAIPLIPHYLSGMILNQGDRIVIDRMVGKSAVAMYGVAYSIGMLVQIFINAINSAITPWVYGNLKTKDIEAIRKQFNILLLLVAAIISAVILVCPELVMIFGSEKYANAVYVIPPVAASVYFIFLYGVLSYPEFYYEETKFLMFASFGAAILNVILNVIFVGIFGFVAAGYTTLVCYIVYSLGHYLVGSRVLKMHTGENALIEKVPAIVLSIYVIVMSVVGNVVVPYVWLRYAVIAILIVVTLVNHKRFFSLFSKMKN